jgi:Zn-dependent protease
MLHLGTIRGTTMTVDPSFFFLLVFFLVMNYEPERGMLYAVLWIPVLFVSVLVHELAHASMFGIFGYGPSRVILGGMGGVTINEGRVRHVRPGHDFIISVAGPLSSVVLAFATGMLLVQFPRLQLDPMLRELIPMFISANWLWAFLNMIPLKPLDGGHAVRSFFRIFMKERGAFIVAAWIGIICGALIALYLALSRNFFMALFIALMAFRQFQQWQEFRARGVIGD